MQQTLWGNRDVIAQLYNQGKTESEIIALTQNRRAFVRNILQRLAHPEDFVLEPIIVKPKEVICLECQQVFEAKRRSQKFCSEFCRTKNNHTRPGENKFSFVCKLCKKDFMSWNKDRIYCSRTCYLADPERKIMRKDPANWCERSCANCNKMMSVRINDNAKYCGRDCYRQVQSKRASASLKA